MTTSVTRCELKTARLLLRPLSVHDVADMYAIYSDAETMKHWSDPPVQSREEAGAMIRADLELQQGGTAAFWAICLKDTGRVIGKFTLINVSTSNRRAEIGYILNRSFWRKGYMKEVLLAMFDQCFDGFGLHRLEADIEPDNVASLSLLENLGFRREGYLRERWHVYNEWQDSILLGLIAPDWRLMKAH